MIQVILLFSVFRCEIFEVRYWLFVLCNNNMLLQGYLYQDGGLTVHRELQQNLVAHQNIQSRIMKSLKWLNLWQF